MTTEPTGIGAAALLAASERLAIVRQRIADAARRAGRDPDEITLVGVAKKQPTERILAAIAAGVDVLGQSYIQESRSVCPRIEVAIADWKSNPPPRLEWRMVGRLQRNKAAVAVRLFDVIESVDRPELVQTLGRKAEAEGKELRLLVQVSLAREEQKGGCSPDAISELARAIEAHPNLRLDGLMTVPPAQEDPEQARPIFRRLREIRDELSEALAPRGPESGGPLALSMGMSADLEVAIEEGATLVRVGTALFGERTTNAP